MVDKNVTSLEEGRELLRTWREDNVRRSEEIVEIWDALLSQDPSSLGDERWMILEQVAVAAMDIHRMDVVDRCLKQLKAEFDMDSIRIRRLCAMRYEMVEDWESALKIYEIILEEDDANSSARKRKIAIHRAQGQTDKAVAELNSYLKEFMCDQEAWMELCDLYIQEQEYNKAAFCCEELILNNPNNHVYFQRYADIRYTQGGYDYVEMAKTYYSKATTLNPNNMRALYGLLLASSNLASSPKTQAQKKREHIKTIVWATRQISERYETKRPGSFQAGMLEGLIGQLQINVNAPMAL